ncbi:FGGY-family carbohydrate kinase [Beduinella massiliensis]|uniref:FGGY-family carbohydrate kinase n=1 Tax=Beduinella massiliensis TaxID=1852363 RepID=UPI000C84B789
MDRQRAIENGETVLGIELGSTRIKAVLIGHDHEPIASGSHAWENKLENGIWTYSLEDVWSGLQDCYRDLKDDVQKKYGARLRRVGAIGISAMMHGYLAFDAQGELLTPFRTWRNTTTAQAAAELTELFSFNVPQRWSVAHLYQAILNDEAHVGKIAFITTLSGYVHWKLTGRRVLGIGDASGMFPIDSDALDFDARMVELLDERLIPRGFTWKLGDILPQVLCAGDEAGVLTEAGARLLDVSGELEAGIPLCPPEGDAGTGMAATNSVGVRTGNVSAGTSIFAMIVLERALSRVHTEIDMVTTPSGAPVAMAHCNNCTSDLNAWVNLFGEFAQEMGLEADAGALFGTLYRKALEADADCGGLVAYNYVSGEPITELEEGRPLFLRTPDSRFTLANFMRAHLYAALATLKIGMDILAEEEVKIDQIFGHGGLFKTKGVGQQMMAAALNAPVSVMETAGEGGAWGIALLAAYRMHREPGEKLEDYLDRRVFAGKACETLAPLAEDVSGFVRYMRRYEACIPVEKAATDCLR